MVGCWFLFEQAAHRARPSKPDARCSKTSRLARKSPRSLLRPDLLPEGGASGNTVKRRNVLRTSECVRARALGEQPAKS